MPRMPLKLLVRPVGQASGPKLGVALVNLARRDPSFRVSTDFATGAMAIWGGNEQHLDDLLGRIKQDSGIDLVAAPEVAYREAFIRSVTVDYAHDTSTEGSGQSGRIKLAISPGLRGEGINFIDETSAAILPRHFIAAIERGVREQAECGFLLGYPTTDFDVRLKGGAFDEEDSSAASFEMAGRGALREGARKAGVKLLEPIMEVNIQVPETFHDVVTSDLLERRGTILMVEGNRDALTVRAHVPLGTMFGYINALQALTQGQAQHEMEYSHYDDVPMHAVPDGHPPEIARAPNF